MSSPDSPPSGRFDGCFLSRPRPIQGEHFDAYLHRVLRANGHDSLRGLVDGGSYSDDDKKAFLMRHLCASDDELERLCVPSVFVAQTRDDRKLVLTPRIRWCPQCIADNPVFLGRWLYRTTVVCTRHRAFMHDECPQCHTPQKIHNFSGKCYSCGSPLIIAAHDAISDALFQLQAWLDEALTDGQAHHGLFNLRYHQAAKLMHYLGIVACGDARGSLRETASSRRVLNDRVLMNAAADLITHWPHSFMTLLALRQAVPTTNSVRHDFGNLYTVLYRSLKREEYQFLRDAFENYVNAHWTGVLTKRNRAFSERTRRNHPRMAAKQAAHRMAIAPAVLKRMSTALEGREIVSQTGRRLLTVGSSWLHRVRGATLAQAAGILHLPKRRVRMLIEEGILQPEISPIIVRAAAWFISDERLQALFVRPTVLVPEEGVSLYGICRYGRLSPAEFIALVRALMAQRIDIVNAPEDPVPLGLAQVRRADLRRWLLALRARESGSMSVDEVAKALGVKQQVAYQLVHSGLLRSYRAPDHAQLRVRDKALKAFEYQYISLAQLARNKNTSPKALLPKIRCMPATGPSVDGGRQYFFRIIDLLSSGQDVGHQQ